jgi:uncharacterized protein
LSEVPTGLADDEKLWAMLAHLSPLACLALIGPVVAMLVKPDSAFVKYHATQAIVFQVAMALVVLVISWVTCGLGSPIAVVPFAGSIYLGIQAYGGSWQGYPLFSAIGKPPPALDRA